MSERLKTNGDTGRNRERKTGNNAERQTVRERGREGGGREGERERDR